MSYAASRSSELFEKGYVSNWEFYLVKKDKVHIPVEGTMSVLADKNGERRGSIVILRDITNRKIAERELRETKDSLENIFKTSPDIIMVSDKEGYITAVNDAVKKTLGFTAEELIGEHASVLATDDPDQRMKTSNMIAELYENGFIQNFRTTFRKKNGSVCHLENCPL